MFLKAKDSPEDLHTNVTPLTKGMHQWGRHSTRKVIGGSPLEVRADGKEDCHRTESTDGPEGSAPQSISSPSGLKYQLPVGCTSGMDQQFWVAAKKASPAENNRDS